MSFINKLFNLNLNMGLVKENFSIVKLKDIKLWRKRGFKWILYYPIFLYIPKPTEVIMLGKPQKIEEFGLEKFKGAQIVDFSALCGTYGMGGPGFVGLKIEGDFGTRWLTYCVWSAGYKFLLDNRVLESCTEYAKYYKPWLMPDNYESSEKALKQALSDMTIQGINLTDNELTIAMTDSSENTHQIHTCKYSNKFSERKNKNAFEDDTIGDYWLVTYDGSELVV